MCNLKEGIFINRVNRFIGEFIIDDKLEIGYIPNTGRCKELLIKGCKCLVEKNSDPNRKTQYTIKLIKNRGDYVSLESIKANNIVKEGILKGRISQLLKINNLKSEVIVGKSRLDFGFLYEEDKKGYLEVKSVTLVDDSSKALFPDAVTLRGSKHLLELVQLKKQGYRAIVIFVVMHHLGKSFTPNSNRDLEFSKNLKIAKAKGVEIYAYKSKFINNDYEMIIDGELPVIL